MKTLILALILAGTLLVGCASPAAEPAATSTPDVVAPGETAALTSAPALSPTPTIVPPSPSAVSSSTATPASAGAFHPVTPAEGLPAGEIRNLWIAPDGHLWVASTAGLFLHAAEEWQTAYDGSIGRLLGADADGRIWAVLEGETAIAAYDPSGNWKLYGPEQGWAALPPVQYLSRGYGDGLVTDAEGQVWLATGRDDLRRFDPEAQTWSRFTATDLGLDPPEEEGYQGHFLTDVGLSEDLSVWVGDCVGIGESLSGQGIVWWDGKSWFPAPATAGECVHDLEKDSAGRMWAGGFDALLQYDPASGSWSRISLPPWDRRQLVLDIMLDQQDNPWVEIMRYGGASALGGLARYHLQDGNWVLDFEGWFSSLAFSTEGVAWLCSEGSVYRLEGGRAEEVGTIGGVACQIAVDGEDRIWVANRIADGYGLWRLEPDQN